MVADVNEAGVVQPAMDANLVAFWCAYGKGRGCTLERTGESVWFYTGVPHPMFNGVPCPVLRETEVPVVIDSLQSRIDAAGAPAFWWVGPRSAPESLTTTLSARGFGVVGEAPGMALDLASLDERSALVPGLTVERVEGEERQSLWARIAGVGSGFQESTVERLIALERSLDGADYRAQHRYLGLLDGRPVAASAMVLEAGIAGVYAVATLPDARRRGIGRAMTAAPLLRARGLGYRIATLQSSPMGYPVYEALGFRRVCGYRLFMQTPRESSPSTGSRQNQQAAAGGVSS